MASHPQTFVCQSIPCNTYSTVPTKEGGTPIDEVAKVDEAPPAPAATGPTVEAPGPWRTGLFDCCSEPGGAALYFVSCFLPCVQYGSLVQALPEGSHTYAGSFRHAAAAFCGLEALAWAMQSPALMPGTTLLPLSAILHSMTRSHLRRKYNIQGTACRDFFTAWCCASCALAQETREVIVRNAEEHSAALHQGVMVPPPGPTGMFGHLMMHPPAPALGMPVVPPAAAKPEKEGYEPVHQG